MSNLKWSTEHPTESGNYSSAKGRGSLICGASADLREGSLMSDIRHLCVECDLEALRASIEQLGVQFTDTITYSEQIDVREEPVGVIPHPEAVCIGSGVRPFSRRWQMPTVFLVNSKPVSKQTYYELKRILESAFPRTP